VVTLALDIESAKRDWRSLRPSLLHFFTADDPCIDHEGRSSRKLRQLLTEDCPPAQRLPLELTGAGSQAL
jgi:hypothetical protein